MLYDVIRDAVSRVDALTRTMAVTIGREIAELGDDPMTMRDLRRSQRIVRAAMTPVYGPTKARVMSGQMFREIVTSTDLSAADALGSSAANLDRAMRQAYPEEWRAIRSSMSGSSEPFPSLMTSLGGPDAQAERLRRSFHLRTNAPWVQGEKITLSDRVWNLRGKQRMQIDRALRDGVRRGQGPQTIARRLERYLSPDYAPLRYERGGRVVRIPGQNGGQGASAARRLARTEVQHMHHEAVSAFVDELGIDGGVKWNLSPAHPRVDICDDIARRSSSGFPRGVYIPSEVPPLPHAQCLCNLSPWFPPRGDVIRMIADRYG